MSHGANSQKYGTVRHKESANTKQQSESQKKSESIKPQVKWKKWMEFISLLFFTYKNLKIHIQRKQHNCHTSNSYSFPFKELVNWKNCMNIIRICRIKSGRGEYKSHIW